MEYILLLLSFILINCQQSYVILNPDEKTYDIVPTLGPMRVNDLL